MSDIAAIQAQLVDIQNDRQHKGSIKITLHVPTEAGGLLTRAFGWPSYAAPVAVALAALHPEKLLQVDAQEQPSRGVDLPAPRPPNNKKMAQRAGILANDSLFWCYLEELNNGTEIMEDEAAEYIRDYCQVTSRVNIVPGTPAGELFSELLTKFTNWKLVPVEAAAE